PPATVPHSALHLPDSVPGNLTRFYRQRQPWSSFFVRCRAFPEIRRLLREKMPLLYSLNPPPTRPPPCLLQLPCIYETRHRILHYAYPGLFSTIGSAPSKNTAAGAQDRSSSSPKNPFRPFQSQNYKGC